MNWRRVIGVVLLLACVAAGLAILLTVRSGRKSERDRVKALCVALVTSSPTNREAATKELKQLGSNAVPALVRLLATRDSQWRMKGMKAASKLPQPLRAQTVAKLDAPDAETVRLAAARALGLLGPDARVAIPALARTLEDRSRSVAAEAAMTLARMGEPALPALLTALRDSESSGQCSAAYGLGLLHSRDTNAVAALLRGARDPDAQVRGSSLWALRTLGADVSSDLLQALESGSVYAQLGAAQGLPQFVPDPAMAVPPLLKLATNETPVLRTQAINSLGLIQPWNELVLDVIVHGLSDPHFIVRLAASNALAQNPARFAPAFPTLTNGLRAESGAVREWSARLLGQLGASAAPALPLLANLSADPLPEVSNAAAQAHIRITVAVTNRFKPR